LLLAAALMGALGVRQPLVYALLGIGVWLAFLKSGVHTTVAGVLLAMTIPARTRIDPRSFVSLGREILSEFERAGASSATHEMNSRQQAAVQALELVCKDVESPLQRLERALHPWVAFFVMPLFALANAGVVLDPQALTAGLHPVSLGIVLGLLLGKPMGITLFSWLAVRLKLATLPSDLVWRHIAGVGLLGGIGFTMSLFIAQLAFPVPGGEWLSAAKLGILTGSLLAGLGGWAVLRGVPMAPR
jgi:NhaA family Na+:H+ antiporter